jgi:hypothetical protein
MPGAPRAPAASCAKVKSTRVSHHRFAEHSGIPCAIGFNGLLHALPGERAFLPPSSAQCASIVADLMPASRHQDRTASPSAPHALVRRSKASIASRGPRVVTIAIRPSIEARDATSPIRDLPDGESGKFLKTRVDFANGGAN